MENGLPLRGLSVFYDNILGFVLSTFEPNLESGILCSDLISIQLRGFIEGMSSTKQPHTQQLNALHVFNVIQFYILLYSKSMAQYDLF